MAATTASTALVPYRQPGALTKTTKRSRARKRITMKEVGVTALGLAAGGAGTAVLHRYIKLSPEVSAIVIGVGAGIGAAVTKDSARAFLAGTAGGGAAMLTASIVGAFKKGDDKKTDEKKTGDKPADGDTKQLDAGKPDVVQSAPSDAKNANAPRNATITEQVRVQIDAALRDAQRRQRAA